MYFPLPLCFSLCPLLYLLSVCLAFSVRLSFSLPFFLSFSSPPPSLSLSVSLSLSNYHSLLIRVFFNLAATPFPFPSPFLSSFYRSPLLPPQSLGHMSLTPSLWQHQPCGVYTQLHTNGCVMVSTTCTVGAWHHRPDNIVEHAVLIQGLNRWCSPYPYLVKINHSTFL